jgi:hypothetical protein
MVHSEMQARTILLGKNKSYRICIGNSNYTFGQQTCVREIIPLLQTAEQKKHCLSVASDLVHCVETDGHFFKNVVTAPLNHEYMER